MSRFVIFFFVEDFLKIVLDFLVHKWNNMRQKQPKRATENENSNENKIRLRNGKPRLWFHFSLQPHFLRALGFVWL